MKFDNIELTTEVALIKAIYFFIHPKLKNGRLKNKIESLSDECDKILDNKIKLNRLELGVAKNRIDIFQKAVGWEGKQRHVLSLVSFTLALIDESNFDYKTHAPKIIERLNDIYEYFERGNNSKILCSISGDIAMRKWRKITELV